MMEPSFHIIKILGIPIRLHWTFLFVIPLVLFLYQHQNVGETEILFFLLTLCLISVCVIIHELAHAWVARRYDVETDDIIVSPFFGVARLQQIPKVAIGEFLVALAGPASNAILCGILFLCLHFTNPEFLHIIWDYIVDKLVYGSNSVAQFPKEFRQFHFLLAILFFVNASLVVFNLIPAFPMDGGRMLRAGLHHFLSNKLLATQVSVGIGLVLSVACMVLAAWLEMYGIILLGAFICHMAFSEYKMVQRETFRNQFKVGEMLKTQYSTLQVSDTVNTVIKLFFDGFEKNFLVFDGIEYKGIVSQHNIIFAMQSDISKDEIIENIYEPIDIFLTPNMKTDDALDSMRKSNVLFLPVKQDGKIIGVLDRRSIYDYLLVQQQLLL